MNDTFKKNLDIIKINNPDIAENIPVYDGNESEYDFKTEIIDSRPVLYAEKEGTQFLLDSLYDTETIAKIWAESAVKQAKYNSKILVFGFGNGIFIRELLRATSTENIILVYEPNLSVFSKVVKEYDISDIICQDRVKLFIGTELNNGIRNAYLSHLIYQDLMTCIRIVHPNYDFIFNNEYGAYYNEINLTFDSIHASYIFYESLGKISNRNTFKNLNAFVESKSLDNLVRNVSEDLPAILVASGPSLSKNITELKRVKGKAIIIAVDSAMRALAKNDIVPDICVTLDVNKESGHFDEGKSKDVPLVCTLFSTPKIVEEQRGERFFYDAQNIYINKFFVQNRMTIPTIESGGTVANNAFGLAVKMGCKNIIFVGQDLAYTGNKTHAGGTVLGDMHSDASGEINKCIIKDINGEDIVSSREFVLYKKWFEEEISKNPQIHFINATEGGAGIIGCEHITLKEAIDRACVNEWDIDKMIKDCAPLFNDEQKNKFIEYISGMPKSLNDLKQQVLKGIGIYKDMLKLVKTGKYNSNEFVQKFNQTKKINSIINTDILSCFIMNEIQENVDKTIKEVSFIEGDTKTELSMLCENGINEFESILMAIDTIFEYYNESSFLKGTNT